MDFWRYGLAIRAFGLLVLASLLLAPLSVLVLAPAPAYDPWMWLLWGREVSDGTLSTVAGPAFKPLPVAVCTLLAPLGEDAAPWAWVVLSRAAALTAVGLAFVVGRRLAGLLGGTLAALGVAFCGLYPTYAASGDVTGLFLALVLGGVLGWSGGAPRVALACAVACALLRVEAWPFALVLGAVLWRRDTAVRPWLAGAAALVPAAWFVPELAGSGDLLRSGDRARIPNPGQPAEATVPLLASLGDAIALPPWPLLAAAVGISLGAVTAARNAAAVAGDHRSARAAAWLAAAGAAWIVLVAVMAQAGFSGEARYTLPGAALIAIAGAVAFAGLPRPAALAGAAVVAVAVVPRIADLQELHDRQAHQQELATDLVAAIDAAGGRAAVLRCGTPYVGPFRGPLLAYRLDVAKRAVEPDATPEPPGTVFRSRLLPGSRPAPSAAGFAPVARRGPWEIHRRCRAADAAR
jgi:hypothetical protein